MQGQPPQHNRFNDPNISAHKQIPAHITYAYKQGVNIARNDDFYAFPNDTTKNKTIDLLFLIASAPVSTVSLPVAGSEAYMGTAKGMELATQALSNEESRNCTK